MRSKVASVVGISCLVAALGATATSEAQPRRQHHGAPASTHRGPSAPPPPAVDPAVAKAKQEFCSAYMPRVIVGQAHGYTGHDAERFDRALDDATVAAIIGRALGCAANPSPDNAVELAYEQLDRGLDSQLLRAVVVNLCPSTGNDRKPNWNVLNNIGEFAMCITDAKALDQDALEKELAAGPFNDWAKGRAREVFANAKAIAARMMQEIDAKKDSDAQVKEAILEYPPRAFAEWDRFYAANKDAIDFARAVEHKMFVEFAKRPIEGKWAGSSIGCADEAHARFNRYVTSKQPKTPEDVEHIVNDGLGTHLLEAVVECDAIGGRPRDAHAFDRLFETASKARARGPRTMLANALVKRYREPNTTWKWSMHIAGAEGSKTARVLADKLVEESTVGDARMTEERKGVVQSLSPHPLGKLVTFKKEVVQVEDRDCQKSRIINWEIDGTPIWDYACKHLGWHTEVLETQPIVVTEFGASLLAPGNLINVRAMALRGERAREIGFPSRVWTDKSARKLRSYVGVPLP